MKKALLLLALSAVTAYSQGYVTIVNTALNQTFLKFTNNYTLQQAVDLAAAYNGELLVVRNLDEYTFANNNLVKRSEGWTWCGVAECDQMWKVNCNWEYLTWKQLNNHWIGTTSIVPQPGAVIWAGQFVYTPRSTKWLMKFAPNNNPVYSTARVVVKIK